MPNLRYWDFLRRGSTEEGLEAARVKHACDPGRMRMDLGIAYLWVGDYESAAKHFQHLINTEPFTVDKFFEMAGVAKWCADDPTGAVELWRAGVGSQFADSGVALSLPLLLFVASILKPTVYLQSEAEQMLEQQLQDPRAAKWPGPLAEFVLGRIDTPTLEKLCISKRQSTAVHRKWRAEFYSHVASFELGYMKGRAFAEAMRKIADTSRPEWSEERDFLTLIWSSEFFVARHEGSRVP